ncbi:putative chemoreceptor glutamine deamidase CheD [Sphingomonas metalli]|uniref:Probable chemoreceptor glutamine deamidase CheD n=1 Tax=Sphingomonas metalli TaxID=1779358 RepID=A0A916TEP5_9SPHN|nr:chemotaxis protein CheD [Sphingomonas metalli]GGB40480.1 putative chemoreceptor glutamine deamidase CheD [Sphingomonas metalli]
MRTLTAAADDARPRRLTIVQGEAVASADRALTLTTILGSCVACCLYDGGAGIGGMNHFLLGDPPPGVTPGSADAERYGLFAMEKLVNEMLKLGASRFGLRAHLYGGGNLHRGMRAIGDENSRFARRFLAQDGIALVREDLGGFAARRVDFQPGLGRARSRRVSDAPFADAMPAAIPAHTGEVELF